jgi:hypothetical protein
MQSTGITGVYTNVVWLSYSYTLSGDIESMPMDTDSNDDRRKWKRGIFEMTKKIIKAKSVSSMFEMLKRVMDDHSKVLKDYGKIVLRHNDGIYFMPNDLKHMEDVEYFFKDVPKPFSACKLRILPKLEIKDNGEYIAYLDEEKVIKHQYWNGFGDVEMLENKENLVK